MLVATVYATYSLSLRVVRNSGSRPKRPTRMSFATSERAALDVENVYHYNMSEKDTIERKRGLFTREVEVASARRAGARAENMTVRFS